MRVPATPVHREDVAPWNDPSAEQRSDPDDDPDVVGSGVLVRQEHVEAPEVVKAEPPARRSDLREQRRERELECVVVAGRRGVDHLRVRVPNRPEGGGR